MPILLEKKKIPPDLLHYNAWLPKILKCCSHYSILKKFSKCIAHLVGSCLRPTRTKRACRTRLILVERALDRRLHKNALAFCARLGEAVASPPSPTGSQRVRRTRFVLVASRGRSCHFRCGRMTCIKLSLFTDFTMRIELHIISNTNTTSNKIWKILKNIVILLFFLRNNPRFFCWICDGREA